MPGKGIQLQMIADQRVQPIEAPPHVACAQAQIGNRPVNQFDEARGLCAGTKRDG